MDQMGLEVVCLVLGSWVDGTAPEGCGHVLHHSGHVMRQLLQPVVAMGGVGGEGCGWNPEEM